MLNKLIKIVKMIPSSAASLSSRRSFTPFAGRGIGGLFISAIIFLFICNPASGQIMPDGSCFEVPPQGWDHTEKGILVVNLTIFNIDKRPFDTLLGYAENELGVRDTHLLPGWSLAIVIHMPSISFIPAATGGIQGYLPWPGCCQSGAMRDSIDGYYEMGPRIIHVPLPVGFPSMIMHELNHHVLQMWGLPQPVEPRTPLSGK